jgi:hybrid cluster-associated redox disulfide protein
MKTKNKTNMEKITKKMSFREALKKDPELAEVFMNKGMHCIGCPMAAEESIEDGAFAHGINPDELVNELNKKNNKRKIKRGVK